MSETADVVIIGGGITGHSIAWHLARRQAGRILILEKERRIGSGSTAYSAGGVREQFTSEINIRMSKISLDVFARFKEEMGQDIDYKRAGYLFLASRESHAAALKQNVAVQNSLGVGSRLVTAEEAQERIPSLNIDDVLLGAFNERDGYVDPSSICLGYNLRARDLGVEVRTGCEVTGMQIEGNRVTAVRTPSEIFQAGHVINAAGPYLHMVGRLAGVEVPARPYRRMLFITERFSIAPTLIPLTVDMATGFYVRQEGDGLMIGLANRDEPSSFNTALQWDYLPQILEAALHRIPVLENARIGKGWAGLYSITPDHHALLGAFPERENFLIAGGFSGHGIMHSPAAGQVISEMILDGASHTIEASSLSPTRIRDHHLLHEKNVI
ncbi:MAG: NAD(P)/FAD-dependent oxidoreductase [Acidobacteriota bacterium]